MQLKNSCWCEHTQRNVTGDYTTPDTRLTIERMRKDNKPLTVKIQGAVPNQGPDA